MPRILQSILIAVMILQTTACFPTKSSQKLQVAANGAYSAKFDARGQGMVLGSFQHGGSYWDIDKSARQFNWNHKEGYLTEILYSDISADGHYAMTANYFNIVLWDTQTGESIWFWEAPARIEAADLSADGRFALLGLSNNKAVLFDIQNGGVLREFEHGGPVGSVAINLDAGLALTGSEDRTARLWNVRTAELIREFPYSNQVSLVALSDSGAMALMVPSNEKAELWNLNAKHKVANLNTAKFRLYSARFIGDTRLLTGTTHRNIFEFDTANGKKTQTWETGIEGGSSSKSSIVLDVGWRGSQLVAVSSNGYLYAY